jgi:hypothetical protein
MNELFYQWDVEKLVAEQTEKDLKLVDDIKTVRAEGF